MSRLTLAGFALVIGSAMVACQSDRDRRADRGYHNDGGNTSYQDNYYGSDTSRDRTWNNPTYGTNRDATIRNNTDRVGGTNPGNTR